MGGKRRPSTQEQSLIDSIAHWKRLRDGTGAKKEGAGARDCACCSLYIDKKPFACTGCPISEYTGRTACLGTPWFSSSTAWATRNALPSRWPIMANREIAFLEDVLAWVRNGKKKITPMSGV